jgi:single-strand DNA-binding protein
VDVEVWGKQAEACNRFLVKGAPAFVEGRLRQDRWDDKATGKPRTRLMIRAERVQFLNGAPQRGPANSAVVRPAPEPAAPPQRPVGQPERGRMPARTFAQANG